MSDYLSTDVEEREGRPLFGDPSLVKVERMTTHTANERPGLGSW